MFYYYMVWSLFFGYRCWPLTTIQHSIDTKIKVLITRFSLPVLQGFVIFCMMFQALILSVR